MRVTILRWSPAIVLTLGGLLILGISTQRGLPLRAPLESVVPTQLEGFVGQDIVIPVAERRVAGMSDYLMRVYSAPGQQPGEAEFSLYVGYYESQTQGKTIHSPKNCLPGAGWEPLSSAKAMIATALGPVLVNRYLLKNGANRALVLYWYQGRGRVAADEYGVKWDLLRDAALHGRSDEALVRIIVPIEDSEHDAFERAEAVAKQLIPTVYQALPA